MRNIAVLAVLLAVAGSTPAAEPPSYARQVRPFLARYCLECHTGERAKSDLDLNTFKSLRIGGKRGTAVVPGKPDESLLVLIVEGKDKLTMPPKKAKQPKSVERSILRTWIAAGARDDSATVRTAIPEIKPTVAAVAPVTALAYRPDGTLLAAGTHREVLLLDVVSGDVLGKLPGQQAKVTALAFRNDGQLLAVASGAPSTVGEVRLYALAPGGLPDSKPARVLAAHADLVHGLTFSPDGKLLATCGYDRLIRLWDVASAKEVRVLKDHSDAVYGVAFSPDGRQLVSGSGDRAVKVWDVATGSRLTTLADSTDWVYAVAWSPDGRHVAAAGVDRSIRIWDVAAGNRLVHAVFAHEGPVTHLLYAPDGKTLYSLAEDRTVKAWHAESMTERIVYPKQPETPLSLALRPDHKQLATGRYDGALVLLDEASGQVQAQPLPAKPKPPQLNKVTPAAARRGQTVRVTFEGKHLDQVMEFTASVPGITGKIVPEGRGLLSVQVDVTLPGTLPAGIHQLGLKGPAGSSKTLPFAVDLFAAVPEIEPNDSPSTGQKVSLPATLSGIIQRPGDVDCFRFDVQTGQQVGVQAVTAGTGTKLDAVLTMTDLTGRLLTESTNGVLGYTFSKGGTYALAIRDRDYRGGPEMAYRLQVGDVPVVTSVFPLGLQRGTEAEIHLKGVYLDGASSTRVKAPADAGFGSRLHVHVAAPAGAPLGNPVVVVGEFPEVVSGRTFPIPCRTKDGNGVASVPPGMTQTRILPVPGTANGTIDRAGVTEEWRFPAKKGQRLLVEVEARRLGSPLDSYIEILDSQGQPVPWVTLRCLSVTHTTFRDHDSAGSGIRIDTWNDLAVKDFLYTGTELMRIRELPRNPDDDCQFDSRDGQRLGFYGTTPTHHSLGTPMYKVALLPPGTTFPPNGLPVVTLFYRNDDGGPGYGKDSRLFFAPPADGEYQVRIGDSRGQGGPAYAYRLTVRPPRPSFNVTFNPTAPAVWKGGAVPITVNAQRTDGFDGPIDVHLENLPPGFSAPATTIPAGEESTAFALWADATAPAPGKVPPLKLVAKATTNGQQVVREATGGVPSLADLGDLLTTTEQSEVTARPGQVVHLLVKIERRNGFAGRVPLEVRGLPHGVHVLDVGLNGILITERESVRTIAIQCEPWVQPAEQPFVVLARREGKNTEHAAKSVLLKVLR